MNDSTLNLGGMIMSSVRELGGFAEDIGDIDGDEAEFNAFNYSLAEEYAGAMYVEDFEALGEISFDLLEKICYWLNYNSDFGNEQVVKDIQSGTLETVNGRTLIDAIYENRSASFAETYLFNGIYSPKLVLTILLSEDNSYDAYVGNSRTTQEEYEEMFRTLYELIDIEYKKQENKKEFLNKIKNNYSRIYCHKNYTKRPIPDSYNWVKVIKSQTNLAT